MIRRVLGLIIGTVMALTVTTGVNAQSQFDKVMERGKVRVGVTSEAAPFGFINKDGELDGFDIDIAKLIAKTIFGEDDPEKHIEFVKQGFAARWPNAESGAIDFGVQVTTILPGRMTRTAFTRPYIKSGMVVLVKKDSPIKSFKDLDNDKYTVANLTNPQQEERAKKFFPNAKVQVFDSISSQLVAIKSNRADAAQIDTPIALWYVKENPEMYILPDQLTPPSNNAVFLKMDDFKWWLVLDTIVGEMTSGSLYPEYAALYEKWFGIVPEQLP